MSRTLRVRVPAFSLACCLLFGSPRAIPSASAAPAGTGPYFAIRVVDEQTGRGVPLVELRTVNSIRYYTDSNGMVAFYEPGLMGRDVFFFVQSHGYEFPKDGFGMAGRTLHVIEGGRAELKIKRINIAERLYRITGGGIYRDSVLLGRPVPIQEPVLNGQVLGQDSIQTIVYRDKLYWFWGDTSKPSYPLGNFHMSGATLPLPGQGGLDPDLGVNLDYFVDEHGFARQMAPRSEPGPVWADAFVTLPDEAGRERMFAAYARVTPTMETVERGLMKYNDDRQILEKIVEFDLKAPLRPGGHPFKHRDQGIEYIWFPRPFPLVRVPADAKALADLGQYEGWTPLRPGSTLEEAQIDRDDSGRIRYAWKKNTPVLDQKRQDELIKAGRLEPAEAWIQLRDADTGKAVVAHSGSVYWNDYRKRWITIRCEVYGTSMLGETWYAEADGPLGPWVYAHKIVTHDKYSFYNPKQHPEFDKDGGRIIYFEGTYTHTFSGNPVQTPRYDYNQIMYKLDLADPRLVLPAAVYCLGDPGRPSAFAAAADLPKDRKPRTIAFFAPDRPAAGLVAVHGERDDTGTSLKSLTTEPADAAGADQPGPAEANASKSSSTANDRILFYALPADTKEPPPTTVPLFEYVHKSDGGKVWTADGAWAADGFRRAEQPVCRVWLNPTNLQ